MNPHPPETEFDADGPDYLWDKSGPPDPEIERLERALAVYRGRGAAPDLPAPRPLPLPPVTIRRAHVSPLPAAAMLLLAIGAALFAHRAAPPWRVEALSGTPMIGGAPLTAAAPLAPGQWLRTDNHSAARIQVAGLGDVDVEPGSTVRIKAAAGRQQRLDLHQGAITARISAPPRLFVVDTPAARAVDMGCEYRLETDSDGSGSIRVLLGWVYLQDGARESRVPMGAASLTRPGRGPGTPFFDDASSAFKDALERFDFAASPGAALRTVLDEARPRDGLSLWHLLGRTSGADRVAVFERLAALKPLPPGLSRTLVLSGDAGALDIWFDDMRPF